MVHPGFRSRRPVQAAHPAKTAIRSSHRALPRRVLPSFGHPGGHGRVPREVLGTAFSGGGAAGTICVQADSWPRQWPDCDFTAVRLDARRGPQQVPPVNASTLPSQTLAALSRRLLWAVLAVAVMIGALGTISTAKAAHSAPATAQSELVACILDAADVQTPADRSGDAAVADHAACGGHVFAPPRSDAWLAASRATPGRFEASGQPAWRPGLSAPPAEPPRT